MADRKDELEARRWFRQRLAELGTQYPALKDPEHQQRLTEALAEGDSFMSRIPTGRPVGRPPGTGKLGQEGVGHTRLTIRIPQPLYDALTAEASELAQTVRAALEHFLACPHKRQTGNALSRNMAHNGQTDTLPTLAEDLSRQTEIPPYDASKYYLGKLCPALHAYHGTEQSLRRLHNQSCRECERLGKRAARAAQRQQKSAGVDGKSC